MLLEIPPEIQMKASIRQGSVFYFKEDGFKTEKPHYFVVLNNSPIEDNIIILVCAVTFDLDVFQKISKNLPYIPKETYVDVTVEECSFLSKTTLFDCNQVFQRSVDSLITKLKHKQLRQIGYIEEAVLERLTQGVLLSPKVTQEIKKIVKG